MNTDYVITTNGLTKSYKGKPAVDHVSMRVQKGDIYGFIGRNGAGKSTTLKMLCGLVYPTAGEIQLFEGSVMDEAARRRIGILIEDAGLYPHLTARENMMLKARYLGLVSDDSVDQALELMNIADTGKKKVKNFSMGMKQRLGIAMALLGNPDLLILDEPINGLDPEGIREIRECIQRLNEQSGKTIIISSHILGELSKLANRYGIIKDGQLVQQITKEELEERCKDYLKLEVDDADRASVVLSEKFPGITYEVFGGNQLHVYDFTDSGSVTALLVENKVSVLSCAFHRMDLEQYFLELMEGGIHNV